jgi:hypothetical protein
MEVFAQIGEAMDRRATQKVKHYSEGLLTGILVCKNGHRMYRIRATSKGKYLGQYYYYCRECPKGSRPFVWCTDMDAAVDDAVMSMADMEHITTTVVPGDTHGDEINVIKQEMRALTEKADEIPDEVFMRQMTVLRDEITRLRNLPPKPVQITEQPDGKSVAEVWGSLDIAGKRKWLLARRGSNWLPGQESVRVQVLGRDPETGIPITDIDLGEFTDSLLSLRKL